MPFTSFLLFIFLAVTAALHGDNPYRPKIYDCFIFFNELEILEIKLHELYEHVDHFVLVESAETFRGDPKPLYFDENKKKFHQFLDKIIHVVVTEHLETNNPWDREYYQRNQILRGLTNCHDQDIVVIEDLDEIISASKLPEIIDLLTTNKLRYVTCRLPLFTYYLNRSGQWGGSLTHILGPVVAKYADVKLLSPQGIRNKRDPDTAITTGWHFTYMGGVKRVIKKFESFSHSELDTAYYKDPQWIQSDINALKLVEIDESYPQFVRDNLSYFKEIEFIDMSGSY